MGGRGPRTGPLSRWAEPAQVRGVASRARVAGPGDPTRERASLALPAGGRAEREGAARRSESLGGSGTLLLKPAAAARLLLRPQLPRRAALSGQPAAPSGRSLAHLRRAHLAPHGRRPGLQDEGPAGAAQGRECRRGGPLPGDPHLAGLGGAGPAPVTSTHPPPTPPPRVLGPGQRVPHCPSPPRSCAG